MVNVKDIKIGDVVYVHVDNDVYSMVIQEIRKNQNYHYLCGVSINGVTVGQSSVNYAYHTKKEAVKSYMNYMTEKMINTISGIE